MKQAFSIIFAILTLSSSMQLSVASHYCHGELAQTKLVYGHGTASCGMHCSSDTYGNTNHKNTIKSKSCCKDAIYQLSTEDYQPIKHNTFIQAYSHGHGETKSTFNPTPYNKTNYQNISPPLITEVSLSFIQVFII